MHVGASAWVQRAGWDGGQCACPAVRLAGGRPLPKAVVELGLEVLWGYPWEQGLKQRQEQEKE